MSTYTKSETKKLKDAGISIIEDKDYTIEERKVFGKIAMDFIMSQSSKDISNLLNEYRSIIKI